ncbi:hypothetical protein [Actinomadura rupiterrae]|uniref:hypothetical protein n=1 Tax=Actinomadura rupiterrae TaxID=559627 RepID=UPI0020A55B28|nr:hypothetical protein [Actinomadura rupiterrae]MCP2341994.1 hypothetical protein [Actinomadura rupiterrae]
MTEQRNRTDSLNQPAARGDSRHHGACDTAPTGQPNQTLRPTAGLEDSDGPTRFAFYGRSYGSPAFVPARRSQQLAAARDVVRSVGGQIVAEFFDSGPAAWVRGEPPLYRLPWGKGPQARALIEALRRDEFDAVVVGVLDGRTFGATHLWEVVAFLDHYGKRLWIPDINGPLDPTDEVDALLMRILIGIPLPGTGRERPLSGPARLADLERLLRRDRDE